MANPNDGEERLAEILGGADSRDAKLWAILTVLEDVLELPAAARLAGDRVEVTHVEYGGDEVQGLIATVGGPTGSRSLPLADVMLLSREPGAGVVRAYADWVRGRTVDVAARAASRVAAPDPTRPTRLIVLTVSGRTAKCRELELGEDVVYRPADRVTVAPGTIITIAPKASRSPDAGDPPAGRGALLEGEITAVEIDARLLGLEPQGLIADEDGVNHELPAPAREDVDDVLDEADLLAAGGDPLGARRLLLEVLADHPGLIAGHRHLGELNLDGDARLALTHFAVGAAIGDLVVPEPLDGILPGERPANRPYLACLFGCARALHRLGRDGDAAVPLRRMLALDPDDHFGADQLLTAIGGQLAINR